MLELYHIVQRLSMRNKCNIITKEPLIIRKEEIDIQQEPNLSGVGFLFLRLPIKARKNFFEIQKLRCIQKTRGFSL